MNRDGVRRRIAAAAVFMILAAALGGFTQESPRSSRPAILTLSGDTGTHDPTIILADGTYYRFSTGPGITVSASDDLSVWRPAGQVFRPNPDWTSREVPGSTDLWAPEVVYVSGRYRLYYSVSTFGSNRSAIGLATNATLDPESPEYRWVDEGPVVTSSTGDTYNAIDPAVVRGFDGSMWLTFGSFWSGIKLVELEPSTGKPKQGAALRSIADRRTPPNAIEAPFILPKDGWYYLFVSFDFCCRGRRSDYKIAVGRSREVTGPYLDRNRTPMTGGGGTVIRSGDERVAGAGHNSILVEEDGEYIVYHAYDLRYGGLSKLRIERLSWDSEGWPIVPSQPEPAGVNR